MKIQLLAVALFSLFVLSCNSGPEKEISIQGNTMGTYYRVKVFGHEKPKELKAKVDKFLRLYNNIFSTYIKDSELSQLNQSNFDKKKLSSSLEKVMLISLDIYKKSGGYFDVTVGPLVNAWGFGPDGKQKKPSDEDIKNLLARVGSKFIAIDEQYIERKKKNLYIDLSAIAKGFGVDELIKFLEFQGYKDLLVEIGGEIRTRGKKPNGKYWIVGIEAPSESLGSKIQKVVPLKNMAMATSGSYRNYLKYGDQIFHHTIDPKTGYPAKHKTISVSVLHEYCADADAWATAFLSMGAEKAINIANKFNLRVFLQTKENNEIKVLTSRAFDKYIGQNKEVQK